MQSLVNDETSEKCPIKFRRSLKGHTSKVNALQWAPEKPVLVTAGLDGRLLVWDALTSNKLNVVYPGNGWMMTCAYMTSSVGDFVACGGLDNICSIFKLDSEVVEGSARDLRYHTGFVSCCRFLNERQMLTTSGDGTCILWDLNTATKISQFSGHTDDVMR